MKFNADLVVSRRMCLYFYGRSSLMIIMNRINDRQTQRYCSSMKFYFLLNLNPIPAAVRRKCQNNRYDNAAYRCRMGGTILRWTWCDATSGKVIGANLLTSQSTAINRMEATWETILLICRACCCHHCGQRTVHCMAMHSITDLSMTLISTLFLSLQYIFEIK